MRTVAQTGIMISLAVVGGFLINHVRPDGLPLMYKSHTDQLDEVVRGVSTGTPSAYALLRDKWQFPRLSLQEFNRLAGSTDVLIVDARPKSFYRLGHIPKAISVARNDFKHAYAVMESSGLSTTKLRLLVYCTGNECEDSHLVAAAFRALGNQNVAIFEGGYNAWINAGLPVEGSKL